VKRHLVVLSDAEAADAIARGEVRRTGHLTHGRTAYEVVGKVVRVVEEVVDVAEAAVDLVKPKPGRRRLKRSTVAGPRRNGENTPGRDRPTVDRDA